MWQRKIIGVQYISFAQLAKDVEAQTLDPARYRAVVGLPRSGLTVAHMLGSHLNCPATQIHAPAFRQRTGRKLRRNNGPWLVVDDCCSFGTAILEARKQIKGAEFGVAAAVRRDY